MKSYKRGISVIVCCFNSAKRIEKTLEFLYCQNMDHDMAFEVVLVDNGSTDNTASIVFNQWQLLNKDIPLRIIQESRQGLLYARQTGIAATLYDYIVFCDDDNWLSDNYLKTVICLLDSDSKIAACGGLGIPVFENAEPHWFNDYREAFATGPQFVHSRSETLTCLYGAGMAVRKDALFTLQLNQFVPLLTGRKGTFLSSGEDTELTNSLVLAGYRLIYSSDLVFRHYMPASRMNLAYLRSLFISFGTDGPIRNLYKAYLEPGTIHEPLKNWYLHCIAAVLRFMKYLIVPPKKSARCLFFNWSKAYLISLWKIKSAYSQMNRNIKRIAVSGNHNDIFPYFPASKKNSSSSGNHRATLK